MYCLSLNIFVFTYALTMVAVVFALFYVLYLQSMVC